MPPLFQVDAFTDTPFAGNPAAVCLLDAPRSADWMQAVAAEMNLSETAFLRPAEADGDLPEADAYRLRWFTPTREVDLCGHATLASAHVLWATDRLGADQPARFHTASGTLTATREASWITMDFPADAPDPISDADRVALAAALGADVAFAGRSERDLLAVLDDPDAVRALTPDMDQVQRLNARGVIATAPADGDDHDFVSRFFAPQSGVPEDPVTGSAHCCLGPYWSGRLGQNALVGRQVSERGGTVRVQLDGPASPRVALQGQAIAVLEGTITATEAP
jgi:PhzF family phenazine biosynthesis protein